MSKWKLLREFGELNAHNTETHQKIALAYEVQPSLAVSAIRTLNDYEDKIKSLTFCLKRIIDDLPPNRNWLDPDLEKMAKNLIEENK